MPVTPVKGCSAATSAPVAADPSFRSGWEALGVGRSGAPPPAAVAGDCRQRRRAPARAS